MLSLEVLERKTVPYPGPLQAPSLFMKRSWTFQSCWEKNHKIMTLLVQQHVYCYNLLWRSHLKFKLILVILLVSAEMKKKVAPKNVSMVQLLH